MSGLRLRRVAAVAGHAAASYLPPLLGATVSLLVVRRASVATWGAFVAWAVPVQLIVHVASWGNKEYLLRALARSPGRLTTAWQSALVSRLVVALPAVVLLALATAATGPAPALVVVLAAWCCCQVLAQSYDVLVLYRRAFGMAMAVEVAGFMPPLAVALLLPARLDALTLAAAFAAGAAIRLAAFSAAFRRAIGLAPRPRLAGGVDRRYFAAALPFFLLSFSGMLMSRTDLYCVAALLDQAAVGTYQVLTSFLLALQSLGALVLMPWVKALYRLPAAVLWRTTVRLALLGIVVTVPATVVLGWLLAHLYRLEVAPEVLVVGAVGVMAAYPTTALIYLAFRGGRQGSVVRVNLAGAAVNLALNLALLPVLGMLGAVLGTAVAQLVMLAAHFARELRSDRTDDHAVPDLR